MVRVNIIEPRRLADQHLIAEYNEILMLLGHVKKFPTTDDIPENYKLGQGHIKFFKNKLEYLKERHEKIKTEMKNRGFKTEKTINLNLFDKKLINNWKPKSEDYKIITKRLVEKINRKPEYYRYCGEKKDKTFFLNLLN